jgi:hypothetical protein
MSKVIKGSFSGQSNSDGSQLSDLTEDLHALMRRHNVKGFICAHITPDEETHVSIELLSEDKWAVAGRLAAASYSIGHKLVA